MNSTALNYDRMAIAFFLLFVQLQTRQISEHTSDYRIEFKYPEIAGAESFNVAVKQILDPLLKECREGGTPTSGGAQCRLIPGRGLHSLHVED